MSVALTNMSQWAKTDAERTAAAYEEGTIDVASANYSLQPHTNAEFIPDNAPDTDKYGRGAAMVNHQSYAPGVGQTNHDARARGLKSSAREGAEGK